MGFVNVNETITGNRLADGAVTTAKIKNGAVTKNKLSSDLIPHIYDITDEEYSDYMNEYSEYELVVEVKNTEYRFGAVTSLFLSVPYEIFQGEVEDYTSLIHFSTGNTPPEIGYGDEIKLKGDNVTVAEDEHGDKYYEFEPQPNMRYDIGFEWDGRYVKGYVSGTELI